jgi:predicted transcriptional regulator YdeE
MTDIVERLRKPPFGTETSERNIMNTEEIERLREAVKVQANAAKMIDSAWAKEINYHRESKNDYDIAIATLDSEREANKLLTAEIERLRHEITRIADLTERWQDNLVSQVNEIARTALEGK